MSGVPVSGPSGLALSPPVHLPLASCTPSAVASRDIPGSLAPGQQELWLHHGSLWQCAPLSVSGRGLGSLRPTHLGVFQPGPGLFLCHWGATPVPKFMTSAHKAVLPGHRGPVLMLHLTVSPGVT